MKKIFVFILCFVLLQGPIFADKERHGGFEYQNSRALLEIAISELYNEIRSADEAAFPSFNHDWNKEKLADLIKTTRFACEEETVGINVYNQQEKRMFDYILPPKESPYIRALKAYFAHYASTPLDVTSVSFQEILRDVKTKLLHEASHIVWEFNEDEAAFYASIMMQKLESTPQSKKGNVLKAMLEYLRQKFISAHAPSFEEWEFDKKWQCWEYDIRSPDLFGFSRKYYQFSSIDAFIMELLNTPAKNYVYSQRDRAFISNHHENGIVQTEYLKSTSDGFLVIEQTQKPTRVDYIPSTLTHDEEVVAYFVCSINKLGR